SNEHQDEVHETLIIAVFIDGSRSVMRVRFYQRSADQERGPRPRASFAFVGCAADRWTAKACAGSGHRLSAQARTRSHDGLLPKTRRARTKGHGLWWLGWRRSKS